MSAVTALPSWVDSAVPATAAATGTPVGDGALRRGHLRAVPDLPVGAEASRTPVRVTRRGRLVLTTSALLLCLTGVGVGAQAAIGGTSAPAYDTVVVQPGQTLSQIAQRAYPQMSVGNAIQRVQGANRLNGLQVFAGERLQLPR